MAAPLVSIVIPTRNRADILDRCLEALALQTHAPIEVIVIDDASSDATQDALARFRTRRPELTLHVLRNDPQRGANPSRKRGIELSKGELVAFEDDDCIAEPQWIAELVAGFVSERVAATTGIVLDPAPRNVYDLAFGGTHLVYGAEQATRLVAGNMCVRRELLAGKLDDDRAEVSADTSVSGRGDEEDLFLKLKAAGFEVRVAHRANVLHVHYYSAQQFFRQAYKGGGGSARLGYKYGLSLRPELCCLLAGYMLLLASPVLPLLLLPATAAFGLFAAATLVYNEIWRKRKTGLQALRIAPVMLAYYHVRAFGYFRQLLRLRLGLDHVQRGSLT